MIMLTREGQLKARKKAMRLLEHMNRTEKGLYEKLRESFSPEEVQDAVEYVKSFGYINDLRYAQTYISGRIQKKSRQKIFQELFQKGIDRETAEQAWASETEFGLPDEKELIRQEIEKKYEAGALLQEKELRRLIGYFARRGFKNGDVFRVLEELHITCAQDENL